MIRGGIDHFQFVRAQLAPAFLGCPVHRPLQFVLAVQLVRAARWPPEHSKRRGAILAELRREFDGAIGLPLA